MSAPTFTPHTDGNNHSATAFLSTGALLHVGTSAHCTRVEIDLSTDHGRQSMKFSLEEARALAFELAQCIAAIEAKPKQPAAPAQQAQEAIKTIANGEGG